jgi:sugar phosphate isomerase/epimerase
VKLACQENLLEGQTTLEQWAFAQGCGFEGIELQAGSLESFQARMPQLLEAKKLGVIFSSICLAGGPFIGEFDAEKRKIALERMKGLLELAPELGAVGVVTPAAWGIFSKRLPPHKPPRSDAEDQVVLLEGLYELGVQAQKVGDFVLFEPLNRYEDHMINTLETAAEYCQAVGLSSVKIMADFYHMNIEEAQIPASLIQHKDLIAHIHLADSNRLEAGAGHTDFASAFAALKRIQYGGWMAFEGRLGGDPGLVLPKAVRFLRALT